MSLSTMPREHRVAILLNILGGTVADKVLAALPDEDADKVRPVMSQLGERSVPREQVESLINEFERMLRLALDARGPNLNVYVGDDEESTEGDEAAEDDAAKVKEIYIAADHEVFDPTEDPQSDINRLSPRRIAAVLTEERPHTVAAVLQALNSKLAAQVLTALPDDLSKNSLVAMNSCRVASKELLNQILRTVVYKALGVNVDDLDKPTAEQRMAEVLRGMPRNLRVQALEALQNKDAETAERIRERLYSFDDVARVTNRSMQQLLGMLDSALLSKALMKAPEAISSKVTNNMAKRAREALMDEMQFAVYDENETLAARKKVVAAMLQLESSGELGMEE